MRPPSLDTVQALGLDSVAGAATVYFRTRDRERALGLHALLSEYLAFYRDLLGIQTRMFVAVLDAEDWARVTNIPYGLPNSSGPGGANLLLAAASPPAQVGARSLPRGRNGDLLTVGHEGGHLLTWELMPPDLKAGLSDPVEPPPDVMERLVRVGKVPAWYWEMAANYFTTVFLARVHPQDSSAWTEHLREITSINRPRFTHLGNWFGRVLQASAPDSTPYVFSTEGGLNQGWYQGVVGFLAIHMHGESGTELIGHIRATLSGASVSTTGQIVLQLDSIANGASELLTRLGASWADSAANQSARPQPPAAAHRRAR